MAGCSAGGVPAGCGELPQAGGVLLPWRGAGGRGRAAGATPGRRARVFARLFGGRGAGHGAVWAAAGGRRGGTDGLAAAPGAAGGRGRHAALRHPSRGAAPRAGSLPEQLPPPPAAALLFHRGRRAHHRPRPFPR